MRFCIKCGKELSDNDAFCSSCGSATSIQTEQNQNDDALITELATKINTNAIIWLVIGVLQIIAGIVFEYFLAVVGILNIISAISDMVYCKALNQNRTGIVERFEPLMGPIIALGYNLIFGGVIGVVGSIYYLVAIRNFVLQNRQRFLNMEVTAD